MYNVARHYDLLKTRISSDSPPHTHTHTHTHARTHTFESIMSLISTD